MPSPGLPAESVDVPARRRGSWRTVVVTLLVTLAALVAPLAVLATWASSQISDTDRYLETIAPLASDPDVQDAVADRLEQLVFSRLAADTATARLADSARGLVRARIESVVRSEAFETAWIEANRTAHGQLVAALTGQGTVVNVDRGTVSVDLAELIGTVKAQLLDSGFALADRIPEINASFEILQSDDLSRVQDVFSLLDRLSTWLPVVGVVAFLVAVLIARNRRRTLLAAGLAVSLSMVVLGIGLTVARTFYLDALPPGTSVAAAGAIYDQIASFIRLSLRGVLVAALTLAVVMWLSASRGPVRRRLARKTT